MNKTIGKAMAVAADRHNHQRETILQPYRKAIEIVTTKRQWSNGETVTVVAGPLQGKASELYIKNEGGRLSLVLFREGETLTDRFYSQPFLIGHFDPVRGWCVPRQVTEDDYRAWNIRIRSQMGKGE